MSTLKRILDRLAWTRSAKRRLADEELRIRIINHYSTVNRAVNRDGISQELCDAVDYLKHHPLSVFPSTFSEKYKPEDVEVFSDPANGLKYVLANGKRLYFKRKSSTRGIRRNFTNLRREQDIHSPHRYLTDAFTVKDHDVIADIGAAEGNFTLSAIERIDRAFLFEADGQWIEALNATFAPWKEKVEIINRHVSDTNDKIHITIDNLFADREIHFMKMDVEGAEEHVIHGAERFLSRNRALNIAVCTYHKQEDEKKLSALLTQKGFETSVSDGYMLYSLDQEQRPPYFRRGLIRARKLPAGV